MKLNNKHVFIFALVSLTILTLASYTISNSATLNEQVLTANKLEISESKAESSLESSAESELAKKKHHKKNHKRVRKTRLSTTQIPSRGMNGSNDSLRNSTYRDLNYTYIEQPMNEFKEKNRNWQTKVSDKQLEEIFKTMGLRSNTQKTMFGDRAYMEIFLNGFRNCDLDKDNVLNIKEFRGCMGNDTYLKRVSPPPANYANIINYTDPNYFYNNLFNNLDTGKDKMLNFYQYMELRLFIYSWRKCSVIGPYIEETSWECAIEIVAGKKASSRTSLRNSYYMALEITNAQNVRMVDFSTFILFASSARLYGRINSKEDLDISKTEFNLVLDENMLPARYNQFIIDTFFKLSYEDDHEAQGKNLI
jgi:hypothetical protein